MPARHFCVVAILLAGVFALPACKKDSGPSPTGGNPPDAAEAAKQSPEVLAVRTKLRQIGESMHRGHDATGAFPGGYYGPDGKTVGLSWRVALLPYIDEGALHKQFKLDEPWDSEHNKKLIEKMPKVYASPSGGQPGTTYFRTFAGKGAFIDPSHAPVKTGPGTPVRGPEAQRFGVSGLREIRDGYSNTAMVVEAAEAVVWTKPDELEFTPDGPLPKLGGVSQEGTSILLCDGDVYFMKRSDASPKLLKALIKIDDGEGVELPGHR